MHEYEPQPHIDNVIDRLRRRWNSDGEFDELINSDEDFLELLEDTLDSLVDPPRTPPNGSDDEIDEDSGASGFLSSVLCNNLTLRQFDLMLASLKYIKYLAFFIIFVYVTVYLHNGIYRSMISCIQDLIYPGLRFLRKLCIPVLSLFPTLTKLYHETCLIENPFFAIVDMDCWPCRTVNNIMEAYTIPKPINEQHIAPFTYRTEQEIVTPIMLKHFYMSNKNKFDDGAPQILIDNKNYITPNDMILQLESGEKHNYVWKFNNNNAAQILRKIIPRPQIVPRFGQSTERYLIVHTSEDQFRIPDTECNFSFILSLSGSQTIELRPAEECKFQCKSLKVELKETYLLWYNWWYWRPLIQSSTRNTTFVAHLGSYC